MATQKGTDILAVSYETIRIMLMGGYRYDYLKVVMNVHPLTPRSADQSTIPTLVEDRSKDPVTSCHALDMTSDSFDHTSTLIPESVAP